MSEVIDSMEVTRVVIPRSVTEERGQEVLTSINFVETLRAQGVPVVGKIIIRGVTHGTLSHTLDFDNSHVFEWVRPLNTASESDLFT